MCPCHVICFLPSVALRSSCCTSVVFSFHIFPFFGMAVRFAPSFFPWSLTFSLSHSFSPTFPLRFSLVYLAVLPFLSIFLSGYGTLFSPRPDSSSFFPLLVCLRFNSAFYTLGTHDSSTLLYPSLTAGPLLLSVPFFDPVLWLVVAAFSPCRLGSPSVARMFDFYCFDSFSVWGIPSVSLRFFFLFLTVPQF